MANLTQTESNNILAASSGQAPYSPPVAPVMVALVTAMGDNINPGQEVIGGNYTRQPITFAAPAGGVITNATAITVVNMPSCSVLGVDEYDSTTPAPVRRWFGALSTPQSVNGGDTFSVAIGAYQKAMS